MPRVAPRTMRKVLHWHSLVELSYFFFGVSLFVDTILFPEVVLAGALFLILFIIILIRYW
jgi:hypothetical protein